MIISLALHEKGNPKKEDGASVEIEDPELARKVFDAVKGNLNLTAMMATRPASRPEQQKVWGREDER